MSDYKKPIPVPDPLTAPYWEAASRHELVMQRCSDCKHYQFYPRGFCLKCNSLNLEWAKVSGRGTVHTYTVVRQNRSPGFVADVPYVLAVVELQEGPHMTTNIVGVEPEEVRIDQAVEVVFEDIQEGISLPKFKPLDA